MSNECGRSLGDAREAAGGGGRLRLRPPCADGLSWIIKSNPNQKRSIFAVIMNTILFDEAKIREHLLTLTYTRPIACLRVGILTIAEKWERLLNEKASFYAATYLREKFPPHIDDDNYWINGAVCPHEDWVTKVKNLKQGEALTKNGVLIAARTSAPVPPTDVAGTELENPITCLDRHWKMVYAAADELPRDFTRLTSGRKSQPIADIHTRTYAPENIFLEEGVTLRAAILNASEGPIYLAKNSSVGEGSVITGPVYLGEHSKVKPLSHIRGNTIVVPWCVVSGEVSCSVMLGFSNKSHAGYLGHSVIGEWCNLGAGTSTSNMKNNYDVIKVWNSASNSFERTDKQYCGLVMGDHSKCGIHTMFNSGTAVGVSCNIFGGGFPVKNIRSFSWGGQKLITYQLQQAIVTARRVLNQKNMELTKTDEKILEDIFAHVVLSSKNFSD